MKLKRDHLKFWRDLFRAMDIGVTRIRLRGSDINEFELAKLVNNALKYTETLRITESPYGQYRYNLTGKTSLLYASVFAALLRSLLGDLGSISEDDRLEWSRYINNFQGADGLFREPLVANEIAEVEDWWGWRHLSLLCLMALTALGNLPKHRLVWLDTLADPLLMRNWLDNLDWDSRVDFTSNAVQNWIASMQYARDFMAEGKFVASVEVALDYLTKKCNPKTGLWGEALPNSPHMLTRQVQAAYHFWLLYAYDCAEPPYIERAVDYVLATQTKLGSYSPVHNKSSACEDIDSVDPLVRYGFSVKQVHDVKKSITRALPWILFNFNRDGGAVFRRDALFEYGHPLMTSHANESSIFATWFRLLSIALIDTINSGNCQQWRFLDAPGYQIHPSAQLSRKRFSSTSSIVTHLTEDEKIFIYNRARMLPKGSQIVEIGSYLGASSCFLAEGGRGRVSKVYCVDTWLNDAMSEGSRDTYTEFLTNTKPYSEIIIPLRGNSVDIGRSFHQTVDLVFLDADHSYEAVSNDLRTWIPKLRPNGWLLLHDYGWAKGVQQAIQEIVIPLQVGEPKTLPNLYAAKVDWQRNNW